MESLYGKKVTPIAEVVERIFKKWKMEGL